MPREESLRQAGEDLIRQISAVMEKVDWSSFMAMARMLPRARRTFVAGAGRSGLVARSFGMRLMHAGLPVFIPGETITPAANEEDLLVAISCTGETGYTDYMARRARNVGAKVILLTAEPDSPLARDADMVLLIPATGSDIVVRAAVFEHTASLCLDAVFNVLAGELQFDLNEYRKRHANLE